MKKVIIFGSTGSIGQNTLDVIRKNPKDFSVLALCAYKRGRLLLKQAREFNPRYVCMISEPEAKRFRQFFPSKTAFFWGEGGLEDFSSLSSDIAVMGISGIASLKPLLVTLKHSKRVALANKESMVCAGWLVKKTASKYRTEIIPVDSEINALFQLFKLVDTRDAKKVYLTASGGAVFDFTPAQIKRATADDVLAHPTWRMGKRITIDSATLLNKGFEVVETHEFFNLDYSVIDIVIHRESAVHACIQRKDGVMFSCMYNPDMKLSLAFALYYPQCAPFILNKRFFKKKRVTCTFLPLDYKKFPLLELALKGARRQDNSLIVLNASDEIAVRYFLKRKLNLAALCDSVAYTMSKYTSAKIHSFNDIIYWDRWAREKTKRYIERKYL